MTALAARTALALAGLFAGIVAAQQTPSRSTATIAVVLRGDAAGGSVGFGKAFELDVVRRWPRGEQPPRWSSDVLAPLVVDELEVTTGDDGSETVETRRCRGFVFQRGAVTLLPEAESPRTLLVDSCLPDGDDGILELPPPPPLAVHAGRRLVARHLIVAVAVGCLAWLAVLGVGAFRRRTGTPSPRARLQLEVDALAAAAPATHAGRRAEAVAATRILREAARLARGDTNAAALTDVEVVVHRLLDEAKFAARPLAAEERAQVIDGLRRAVAAVPEGVA